QSSCTSALARACFSPAALSWAYMRMFVSTKYLSLMEFVPRLGWCPLQVQALAQSGESAASRCIKRLAFPYDRLQAVSKKRADGPAFVGGDDACFPKQIGVEL